MTSNQTTKGMLIYVKYIAAILFYSWASITSASDGKLPRKTFYKVISQLEEVFVPIAAREGRILKFYYDYDLSDVQAFARRWETDQVIVFGGMASLSSTNQDVLTLALCHELGHLYGGMPYADEYNRLSAEGQADYWATKVCFPEMVQDHTAARARIAALALTAFYADKRGMEHPRAETPDRTVVEQTLISHPGPQCRLDTYLAGIQGWPRPACWYLDL